MNFKLFKRDQSTEFKDPAENSLETQDNKIERMEKNLDMLTIEVARLRQDVNGLLTRQQTIKIALRRLREYLEEKGAISSSAEVASSKESKKAENYEEGSPTEHQGPRFLKSKDHLH